jgi:hypothetical protein
MTIPELFRVRSVTYSLAFRLPLIGSPKFTAQSSS